jgi:hypothetical protein
VFRVLQAPKAFKVTRGLQALKVPVIKVIRVRPDPKDIKALKGRRVLRGFKETKARPVRKANRVIRDPQGLKAIKAFRDLQAHKAFRVTRVTKVRPAHRGIRVIRDHQAHKDSRVKVTKALLDLSVDRVLPAPKAFRVTKAPPAHRVT